VLGQRINKSSYTPNTAHIPFTTCRYVSAAGRKVSGGQTGDRAVMREELMGSRPAQTFYVMARLALKENRHTKQVTQHAVLQCRECFGH